MDLPLDTHGVTASCHYRLTGAGQAPEAALILGENKDGPVRVKCEDAQYWRKIEAAAGENAQFLEDAHRGAAA
jgi:hypothetical protein